VKTIPGIPYAAPPRTAAVGSALAQPPKLVVVHCTSNTATAAAEARYAATRTDASSHWTSCHVYVDEHGALGSLSLDRAAWAAYGWANARGWHVELCGLENRVPEATQRIGAAIVRQLCQLGAIPMVHLDGAAVRALHDGRRSTGGVTGHADITAADFDGNDHSDPGDRFDWPRFMGWVNDGEGDDMSGYGYPDPGMPIAEAYRMDALMAGADTVRGGPYAGEPMWLVTAIKQLQAQAAADAARDAAAKAAIDALAAAITAGGGSVDSAAIIARINAVAAAESQAVAALQAELADLRADLAAAHRAAAHAIDSATPEG